MTFKAYFYDRYGKLRFSYFIYQDSEKEARVFFKHLLQELGLHYCEYRNVYARRFKTISNF